MAPEAVTLLARHGLPASCAGDVEEVWAPLAARYAAAARASTARPFVIGLCGPQGSGKTTMAALLCDLVQAEGVSCTVLSLDDYYLPAESRRALGRSVHPLLAVRGPPGSHDVTALEEMIDRLGRPGPAFLSRFDKASDTTKPESEWALASGPFEVIILEGWCVGARPQDPAALGTPANRLEESRDPHALWRTYVNDQLARRYAALFSRLNRLTLLTAPDFPTVVGWRQEQERALRARLAVQGRGMLQTMTDAQVEAFVAHYERLTRHILEEAPHRADDLVRLDARRRPILA